MSPNHQQIVISCRIFTFYQLFRAGMILVFLFIACRAAGFTIVPPVTSFTKNEYMADRQNWNVAQDSHGILYFANNAGLLRYDGTNWQLFRMHNQLGLRSVAIDSNNRIYTGSYEEFGYWESKPDGILTYKSLSTNIPGFSFNNEEIWRIIITGRKVFFQSFGAYFVYDGGQVIQHNTPEAILFFLKSGNTIITQGMQSGLFRMQGDTLVLIPGSRLLKNALIRAAVQLDPDRVLLGTSSLGIFLYEISKNRFTPWRTEADEILISGQINCATFAADSVICIGTIGNGMVAINEKGKLMWHFNKDNSLPTNTVLYLFTDNQNNIWAALDLGLALIRINSPFRYISAASRNIELVYTAIRFNNSLYIGTNQGVFRFNDKKDEFSLIPGTQGQVWQLVNIDNQLLCGHNEGTFRIEENTVIPLSNVTGGTSLKPVYSGGRQFLIQSSYGSLVVFKKDQKGNWTFSHTVRGFSNPVKYIEIDHLGFLWASHFIKGLYRLKLNDDLTEVTEIREFGIQNEMPSDYRINVSKIGNRVIFCTGSQFYAFDDLKEQMVPYTWLNRMTGEFSASHRVIPAGKNKYWLIKSGKFGLVSAEPDSIVFLDILPYSLLKNNLIEQNEYIATLDEDSYLFCLEKGLAIYQKSATPDPGAFRPGVMISQVKVSSNKSSILLPVSSGPKTKVSIPYWYRRIVFTFAYPDYSDREVNLRCTLKGHGDIIRDTISGRLITYAFLEAGQYELEAKTTDENNAELGSVLYYFNVLPPFYASAFAILCYVLLVLVTGYFGWRTLKKQIQKQNEKVRLEQAKLQQEKIERREQKITLLKNEKLEAELKHKNNELASSTLAIIRKNEMLIQLKAEVENQKKKLGNQYPNKYADHLIRMINENISSEDDWDIFQQNFDLIHENFLGRIKSNYFNMTAHDLKLCAYIRLNLSTKEIASLLNITIRGVEAARYRLRKKFNIPAEKNLTEFLMEFK